MSPEQSSGSANNKLLTGCLLGLERELKAAKEKGLVFDTDPDVFDKPEPAPAAAKPPEPEPPDDDEEPQPRTDPPARVVSFAR